MVGGWVVVVGGRVVGREGGNEAIIEVGWKIVDGVEGGGAEGF